MGSPEIMAAWDEMCLKCAEYDAMVAQRDAALALADARGRAVEAARAALIDYRDRIANITSGWGDQLPRDVMYSLSSSHYSVAALLDAALAAAPPPDAEGAGGMG